MIGSGRLLESLRMTGIALSGKPLKLARGCTFVAVVTLQTGVRSYKRKSILVILSAPDNYVPAFDAMTLLASCSHLATMYIGVAVGAIPAGIGKDALSVTLVAGNAFVPA